MEIYFYFTQAGKHAAFQEARLIGPFRHYEMWTIYNISAPVMLLPPTDVTCIVSPPVHICVLSVSVWKKHFFLLFISYGMHIGFCVNNFAGRH